MRFALLLAFIAQPLLAAQGTQKQFVEVSDGRKIWVEHRPAQAGRPTLFLINGLTWSTNDWNALVKELDSSYGIVRLDLEGQGKTLNGFGASVNGDIPFERQARNLFEVQETLEIKGPKVAVGLSYGGGLILRYLSHYPGAFSTAILMAPYLHPLPQHDQHLKKMVRGHRLMFPFDFRSDETLYRDYMRLFAPSTAAFHLIGGSLNWEALDHLQEFPRDTIHLIGAVDDDLVLDEDLRNFWEKLPGGASYVRLKGTGHYIPTEHPAFIARWIDSILKNGSEIRGGAEFTIERKRLDQSDCIAKVLAKRTL